MNPKCPNCGQPMSLIAKPKRADEHHTFECKGCKVVYMTDDHVPVTGQRPA